LAAAVPSGIAAASGAAAIATTAAVSSASTAAVSSAAATTAAASTASAATGGHCFRCDRERDSGQAGEDHRAPRRLGFQHRRVLLLRCSQDFVSPHEPHLNAKWTLLALWLPRENEKARPRNETEPTSTSCEYLASGFQPTLRADSLRDAFATALRLAADRPVEKVSALLAGTGHSVLSLAVDRQGSVRQNR